MPWPAHCFFSNGCELLKQLEPDEPNAAPLIEVARSDKQWTGVTVSEQSRIFVNYPNWSAPHTLSVAEITDTAQVKPYPNQAWNTWNESLDPAEHFICVQSVWVDKQNNLWVLDPANPQRNGKYLGVVPGGAKLVKIDLVYLTDVPDKKQMVTYVQHKEDSEHSTGDVVNPVKPGGDGAHGGVR